MPLDVSTWLGTLLLLSALQVHVSAEISPEDFCQQALYLEGCHGHNPFPSFNDTDVIDVYYDEAPVFERKEGDKLGELHLYHGAVGFRDRTNGLNFSSQFDAFYEVGNATFPHVVIDNTTNQTTIIWCNKGVVCWNDFINETYYNQTLFPSAQTTLVGTVNGTIMNKLIDWLPRKNKSDDVYETWIVQSANGEVYFNSSTCVDYVWDVFGKLTELGADLNTSLSLRRNNINLFVKRPPEAVNSSDPEVWADILKFYQLVGDIKLPYERNVFAALIHLLEQIVEYLPEIEEATKYVYVNHTYYKVELEFPFISITYDVQPLRPL